jgi:hypothetical protein
MTGLIGFSRTIDFCGMQDARQHKLVIARPQAAAIHGGELQKKSWIAALRSQ